MTVRYTVSARRHLRAIADHIAADSPAAARSVGRRIRTAIELLALFPELGRAGALPQTREIVVPSLPYIVVYRADEAEVVVLGVYHGAQKRPGQD